MHRRGKRGSEEFGVNMTPMIDVVFQMIIFFVCTADMDRKAFDEKIKLALAPHGPEVEQRDPRTVTIQVARNGKYKLGQVPFSPAAIRGVLNKAVAQYGQTVPVVIRGDGKTEHRDIKKAMDMCSEAGLWKIKFSAVKERAKPVE